MNYYPTESRGGWMESISRWCRQAYVYPFDTRKLLYAGGALVGIILIAVIWSGFSSSDSSSYVPPSKGRKVLQETPLVVGSNFFPVNLKNLVHNQISRVNFNRNLSNDTVFGNANCKSCQTDIPRLQSGLVASQIWSVRVPCNTKFKDAVALTLEQVDAMSRLLSNYSDNVTLSKSSNEVTTQFNTHKLGGLLAVTSGHSFDGRMSVLRTLYSLGVRVMALTSVCSTPWATSFSDVSETDYGLPEFGKAVVKEMNRLGMLIDLSEASHQTQLDVLNVTKAPVVFTRAAAFDVFNNTRNIKTDVLQKLKDNGGLVMVTFAGQYLNNTSNISISDVIKHLNYIKNITGPDKVGIGAEFDAEGETYPTSLGDVSTFPLLFDHLKDDNWSEDDLKKLAGENFVRVLQQVEKVAKESASLPADETFMLPINSTCYSDYDERLNVSNSSVPITTSTPTASTPTAATTAITTPTTVSTPPNITTSATQATLNTTIAPLTTVNTTTAPPTTVNITTTLKP